MTSKIQKADSAARSRAIWIAVIGLILAAVLIVLLNVFEEAFTEWGKDLAADVINQPQMVSVILFVVMLPLLASSVFVFIQGQRIVRAQRMPYPGQVVIKDTPVIEGPKAVQRGRAIQAIAVIMAAMSVAIPFLPPLLMLYLSRGS